MKKIFLTLLLACSSVWANDTSKIKIVVPYASGGPVGSLAHIVQKSLASELGTTVIIDYRPGAAGSIGTAHALNNSQEPTLVLNTSAAVLNTFKNPQPYSENQLIPLVYLGRIPLVLIGSKKFNVHSLKDLQNFNQRPIMYGTAGMGSAVHLATEKLNLEFNKNMVHVPYKGTSPYLIDTIAGNIDMSFVFASSAVLAHIQNKDVVPIAVEHHSRLSELKSVPTFKESGIDNVGNFSWFALFVAGRWDPQQLRHVQNTLRRIMTSPELSTPYRDFGLVWDSRDVIPTADFVAKERRSVSKLIGKVHLN
jgi:tripartite-type tricarboxylate transporter receptor subunit TctC